MLRITFAVTVAMIRPIPLMMGLSLLHLGTLRIKPETLLSLLSASLVRDDFFELAQVSPDTLA